MSSTRFKAIPAVYIFLRQGDQVLLLQRANTGYQDGNYSVPAGHLEGGELITSAIVREAKEEAGITLDPKNLKLVHVSHRLNENPEQERMDFFFEAWQWQGEITNNEPDKCDDLAWFPIGSLPENMIPHVRGVLEKSLKGELYSEYLREP